jgi:hypothetical protein
MNSSGNPVIVSYHVGDSACETLPAGNGENGASEPCNVDLTPINNDIDNLQEKTKNVTLPVIQGETEYDGMITCGDIKTDFITTGLEDFSKNMIAVNNNQDVSINSIETKITGIENNIITNEGKITDVETKISTVETTSSNLEGQVNTLDMALTSAMNDFPTLSQQQDVENQLQSINYFLQSLNFSSAGQNLLQATAMDSVLNVDSSENTIILGHCNQNDKPSRMVLVGECSVSGGNNYDGTTDSELWFSRGYNITEPHEWKDSILNQSYYFGHTIVSSSQKFELKEVLSNQTNGDDGTGTKKIMSFSSTELSGFNNRFSVYTDNISLAGSKIFLGTSVQSLGERLRNIERALGLGYRPTVEDEGTEFKLIPPPVGWFNTNNVTIDGITYTAGSSVNNSDVRLAFGSTLEYVGSGNYNTSYGSYQTAGGERINGNDGGFFWISIDTKVQIGAITLGIDSNVRSLKLYKQNPSTVEISTKDVVNATLLLEVDHSGSKAQEGNGRWDIPLTTVEPNEKLYIQFNTIMAGEDPSSLKASNVFFEGKFV